MEELPIGAEITIKVVEDDSTKCDGCFFKDVAGKIPEGFCHLIKCCAGERKDGKSVKFVIVEKGGAD